jgi:hypothetical protein
MSVSGSISYTMNAVQIIDKAFRRLGKGSEGEAISAFMYESGLDCLNLILKSKIGVTEHLSLLTEGTLSLLTNQPSYALTNPFALRVTSVRRRNTSGYDVPLNELSREEYFDTPNKTASPSTPVSYYFDPQSTPTLYVWPAPDSTSVSQYTLLYTYKRRPDDMLNSTDSLDMPQEWIDPIIWMLADDLEVEYPVNDPRLAMKVSQKAAQGKMLLDNWDTEGASLYIQPDIGPGA